jgi:hypothetical protein
MDTETLSKIRHAHSLLNGLSVLEPHFYEALDEATETLQSLLPDDNNWVDTPDQILSLVTNA